MIAAGLVQPLSVVFLLVMMASIGMTVTWRQVVTALRQTSLMLRGIVASFVVTPIVTLGFLHFYDVRPMVAVGFLILASCAGAPFLLVVTAMARGDVPSAIGLMVVLAALSAVMAPMLLHLLIAHLPGVGDLHINALAILNTLLLTQIVPLGLALAFHAWRPALASRLVKLFNVLSQLLLLALNVLLFFAYWDDLMRLSAAVYGAMLLLFAAMFATGWLLGGPGPERRKAMALATAVRNSGVSLVIVASNFANTPAVLTVTVFGLVITLTAVAVTFPLRRIGGASIPTAM